MKQIFTPEEMKALYRFIKEYQKNSPDEEHYNNYSDEYEEPISKKLIKSLLNKISQNLPKEIKEEIDKDFLRQKYHPYNNEINERVYSTIEDGFNKNQTIEISYFDMDRAEFKKRKIDVYYKSRRYTIGYCHLRKAIQKFRTSRIASAQLTSKTYQLPEGFNKDSY